MTAKTDVAKGAQPLQYQTLNSERLLETQRRLAERIKTRFPESGLSEVAAELLKIAQEAAVRAEWIRRPHWVLRGVAAVLLLGALGLGVWLATSLEFKSDLRDPKNLFQFVGAALQATVFLGAIIISLVTLEIRWKRRRALAALHTLRAMAHVVDMHQVAKDPEGHVNPGSAAPASPTQSTTTVSDLHRYLHYCNELLAIISKIAALYVQRFPDAPTVSAVDQVEDLCSGLSQRIWQKIVALEQFVDPRKQPQPVA